MRDRAWQQVHVRVYTLEDEGDGREHPQRKKAAAGLESDTADKDAPAGPKQKSSAQALTRIAIVEDERDLVGVYRYALRDLGYTEEFVGYDGSEIVEALMQEQVHPDIILMDYRMPRMSGLDAAMRIREVNRSVRIIIATADDSIIGKAHASGLETIQKPFSLAELRAILNHRRLPNR